MRRFQAALIALACAGIVACAKSTPPPPPTVNPSDPISVTGREHLGWDQNAGSLSELDTVGYYIYVDDKPQQQLTGVVCSPGSTTGSFLCQAPLPSMTAGSHTLQATSFYLATPTDESAKSGPLQIVVQGIVAGGTEISNAQPSRLPGQSTTSVTEGTWPDGLVRIADGLERPTDLAFTPDSRLWIAERSGRVRVLRGGVMSPEPALVLDRLVDDALVSLTADPHFAANHFMFAIYTERSRSGRLTFAIARFREAADTLADRIVILDNIPASSDARAALRFGLDGKLYAAFDDGGDPRLAEDPASFNGKILRLNADGTTPDDAPQKSPIWSAGPASPRGLAWHRATARLWAADSMAVGGVRWMSSPESVAALHDDLFVGSATGLARAQIQRASTPRLAGIHDVLRNVSIRAVTTSPDGTVYVATDTAIGRLQ